MAGAAWRLSDEVTDGRACHDCLQPGLLQRARFGMKATALSCATAGLADVAA